MDDYIPPKQLYREAVQNFPFPDLKRSGGVEGRLSDEIENGLYSEDYSFIAGHLLNNTVQTGWFTKTELQPTYVWDEYHIQEKRWRLVLNTINK